MIDLQDGVLITVVEPQVAVVRVVQPDPTVLTPLRADLILGGAGGSGFVYHQVAPSASWLFANPLGRLPSVQIYDAAGNQCEADVVCVSPFTQVNVISAAPIAGYAVLS